MLLDVKDLNFSYGDKQILHNISFTAERNNVVSILGPNGVGKTTLLKCLCNIHKPSSGTMTIDDMNISAFSTKELARHISYVPQSVNRSNTLVFDSVLIGRRPYIEWTATNNDLEITWSALRALKIEDLALRSVDDLSGGEFQKVQIARAIVQQPDILIMDEPTNNLDIANQHVTMHTIIDAVRSRDVCTIMTMHDINLAVHYSDVFIFMKNGSVIESGGIDIITEDLIEKVYGINADVIFHKGKPFVIPHTFPLELQHIHHEHGGSMHSHKVDLLEKDDE